MLNKQLNDSSYRDLEVELFMLINSFRQNPGKLIPFLNGLIPRFDGKVYHPRSGQDSFITQEGVMVVYEALDFAKGLTPLPAFRFSQALYLSAQTHLSDIGTHGLASHKSSKGESLSQRVDGFGRWRVLVAENIAFNDCTAEDVLINFLLDDGNVNRGHRENLFNAKLGVLGVAFGRHSVYGHCCVANFAGQMEELPELPCTPALGRVVGLLNEFVGPQAINDMRLDVRQEQNPKNAFFEDFSESETSRDKEPRPMAEVVTSGGEYQFDSFRKRISRQKPALQSGKRVAAKKSGFQKMPKPPGGGERGQSRGEPLKSERKNEEDLLEQILSQTPKKRKQKVSQGPSQFWKKVQTKVVLNVEAESAWSQKAGAARAEAQQKESIRQIVIRNERVKRNWKRQVRKEAPLRATRKQFSNAENLTYKLSEMHRQLDTYLANKLKPQVRARRAKREKQATGGRLRAGSLDKVYEQIGVNSRWKRKFDAKRFAQEGPQIRARALENQQKLIALRNGYYARNQWASEKRVLVGRKESEHSGRRNSEPRSASQVEESRSGGVRDEDVVVVESTGDRINSDLVSKEYIYVSDFDRSREKKQAMNARGGRLRVKEGLKKDLLSEGVGSSPGTGQVTPKNEEIWPKRKYISFSAIDGEEFMRQKRQKGESVESEDERADQDEDKDKDVAKSIPTNLEEVSQRFDVEEEKKRFEEEEKRRRKQALADVRQMSDRLENFLKRRKNQRKLAKQRQKEESRTGADMVQGNREQREGGRENGAERNTGKTANEARERTERKETTEKSREELQSKPGRNRRRVASQNRAQTPKHVLAKGGLEDKLNKKKLKPLLGKAEEERSQREYRAQIKRIMEDDQRMRQQREQRERERAEQRKARLAELAAVERKKSEREQVQAAPMRVEYVKKGELGFVKIDKIEREKTPIEKRPAGEAGFRNKQGLANDFHPENLASESKRVKTRTTKKVKIEKYTGKGHISISVSEETVESEDDNLTEFEQRKRIINQLKELNRTRKMLEGLDQMSKRGKSERLSREYKQTVKKKPKAPQMPKKARFLGERPKAPETTAPETLEGYYQRYYGRSRAERLRDRNGRKQSPNERTRTMEESNSSVRSRIQRKRGQNPKYPSFK